MYRNAKQDYEPVQKNSTEEVKKDLKEKNQPFPHLIGATVMFSPLYIQHSVPLIFEKLLWMWCLFFIAPPRFPVSPASQQTQKCAQKDSTPVGKSFSSEVKGAGCSSECSSDLSLFQTLNNLVWNMFSPHPYDNSSSPRGARKDQLILCWEWCWSAGPQQNARQCVRHSRSWADVLSVNRNRSFTQPLCCLQPLATATTSLFCFEGI